MKKADYIVLVLFFLVALGAAAWYFLVYKKKNPDGPVKLPGTTVDPATGQQTVNPDLGQAGVIPNAVAAMGQGSFPLKKGDRSRRVYALQVAGNAAFNLGLSEDGIFGQATENAIKNHFGGVTQISETLAGSIMDQIHIWAQQNPTFWALPLAKIQATF